MTSTRWWAPTAPHLGPDEVDLAMLAVTGDDSRLDMGGVLLAAHRVGEAACLLAAREPICDEGTLVNALAKARGELADPMVDSVSKCVDEGGSYAGLLVRDVLDAADEAAVGLFGAARSRGVAGPLAAARAGAVYGVPAHELGRYRTLAIDPKANAVALTDAADRAVFKYFGELAASETTSDVSKAVATQERPVQAAPTRTRVATWDESKHPRDHGEFARIGSPTIAQPGLLARVRSRYGMGAGSIPQVATGRPSEQVAADPVLAQPAADKPKLTPAQLRQRQQALRRKRSPKAKPAEAAPERTTHQRAAHKRANLKRAQFQRTLQQGKIISTKLQQAFDREKHERVATPEELKAVFQAPEANHWLLDTRDAQAKNYHSLDNPVAYVLDVSDANYLNSEAASSPARLFRIGHLEQLHGGEPEDYTPPEVSGDHSHENNVVNTAHVSDGQAPIAGIIKAEEMPPGVHGDHVREQLRQEWAEETGDTTGEYTSVLPSSIDNGDYYTITQDGEDPPPRIFEYIVNDGRGRVEGSGDSWRYELDPNQAYRMPEPEHWQQVYDPVNDIIRVRVHLNPVAEPDVVAARKGNYFAKAVATEVRTTAALGTTPTGRHYYDQRDAKGEFTRGGLLARVQTAAPAPQVDASKPRLTPAELRRRQQALRRRRRPAAATQDQQQTARTTHTRAGHKRALSQREKAVQQVQQRITDTLYDELPASGLRLDTSKHYRIISPEELDDIRYDNGGLQTLHNGVIHVAASDSLNMLDAENVTGREIKPAMRMAFYDLQVVADGQETKILRGYHLESLQDHLHLAHTIDNKMATGVHGMVVEVPEDIKDEAGNTLSTDMALHVSKPPTPLVLIEFDDSADPKTLGAYDLIPMGEHSHRDRTNSYDDAEYTDDLVHHMHMRVQRYLAVDPRRTAEVLRSRSKREAG